MRRTSHIRIIDLHIAKPVVVQNLQFGLISLCNICKVFRITLIDILGIGPAFLVAHVVPFGRRQSILALVNPLLRYNAPQVVPLIHVRAPDMLNLPCAYDALSWLVSGLGEGSYVWHVHAKDVNVRVLDLLESFHSWEEGAPEHCERSVVGLGDWEERLTYCAVCTRHPRFGGSPA